MLQAVTAISRFRIYSRWFVQNSEQKADLSKKSWKLNENKTPKKCVNFDQTAAPRIPQVAHVSSAMASADVALMRDWLKKNKHLPQDEDDYFIECFIKTAKGSVQKAKQILENFCMIRHIQEFKYQIDWDPFSDEMIDMTNRLAIVKMPKKTPEGYNLIVCCAAKGKPDPNYCVKMMILSNYFIYTLLWEHDLGDCQSVMIADYRNLSFNDFKGLNPTVLTDVARILKAATPHRLKAVFDMNLPPVAEWAVNFLKPFLSDKMNARRFAFSKTEDLLKHVDKKILPAEYGGDEPSVFELYESTTKKYLLKYRERFLAQKEQVLAEKPYVPVHLNNSDYDTFRKLDID